MSARKAVPVTRRLANGHSYYIQGTTVDGTYSLIVPEAAVSGCRHKEAYPPTPDIGEWQFCCNCGSSRCRFDYGYGYEQAGEYSRWQRPRILRVGRASK